MRTLARAWYAGSERLGFHFKTNESNFFISYLVENWKVLFIFEKNVNLETRYKKLSLNFVYLIIDIFNKIAGRLLDKMGIKVIDFNFINAITFSALSNIKFFHYSNSSSYLVKSPPIVWSFFY